MAFFRDFLTFLAGLLIVALTAALAGPWFVDWNAHRDVIQETLAKATGADVKIGGKIKLKLLPSPRLSLGKVELRGRKDGAPELDAEYVRLELALGPLVRGRFRFTDANLTKPVIRLTTDATGAFVVPDLPAARPDQVAVENVVLSNATLVLHNRDSGERRTIPNITLNASGQSLNGPFRGSGDIDIGGILLPFSFNTGVLEGDRLRLKFAVDTAGPVPRIEFDGELTSARSSSGYRLSMSGRAAFIGTAYIGDSVQAPWRAEGPVVVDAGGMRLAQFELKAGKDETILSATGDGEVSLTGTPSARLSLTSQQVNIDRIFAAEGAASGSMRRAGEVLVRLLKREHYAARLVIPVSVEASTRAVTAGREVLTDVSIKVALAPGRKPKIAFSAGLPGQSKIAFDGTFETGSAPLFTGEVEAATRDLRRVESWIARGSPVLAAVARAIPFRRFEMKGSANVSAAGFAGRKLKLAAGRSRFEGTLIYTRAHDGKRARLFADMRAPALDLDGLSDLATPASALSGADLVLNFQANGMRLARIGRGTVDAGEIAVRLTRTAGDMKLEKLSVDNLGGASLEASGRYSDTQRSLKVSLDADRLLELARLIERIAPGPWTRGLVSRSVALSPAKVEFNMQGAPGKAFRLASLGFDGTVNGTRIEGFAGPETGQDIKARFSMETNKAFMLLRQFGLETVALERAGGASVEVDAKGSFAKGFATAVKGNVAGTALSYNGNVKALLPSADVRGQISLAGADASPLLQVLGLAREDAKARAPADISGQFAWTGARVALGNIDGELAGSKFTGQVVLAPEDELAVAPGSVRRNRLTGALRFDKLSLRALAALVLGPPQSPAGDARWSGQRFAPRILDPVPTQIDINSGAFSLVSGLQGNGARMKLVLSPGLVALNDMKMRVGSGKNSAALEGQISFRRDAKTAAVAGKLQINAPQTGIRDIGGRIEGKLEFAATGNSERALVSGLAGRGTFTVRGLRIANADPQALSRVVALAEGEKIDLKEEAISAALRKQLARDALFFPIQTFQAQIASGVLRLRPDGGLEGAKSAKDARAVLDGSAAFNLHTHAFEAALEIEALRKPKKWTGAPPKVSISWSGKPGAIQRNVAARTLVNGLSARAILREAARVEALEFDLHERAYFNRRIKAQEFLRQRREEIKAYEAEQARLAEEARKKAEEEERKRLEEERKQADEARRQAEKKAAEEKAAEAKKRAAREAAAKKAASAPDGATPDGKRQPSTTTPAAEKPKPVKAQALKRRRPASGNKPAARKFDLGPPLQISPQP